MYDHVVNLKLKGPYAILIKLNTVANCLTDNCWHLLEDLL